MSRTLTKSLIIILYIFTGYSLIGFSWGLFHFNSKSAKIINFGELLHVTMYLFDIALVQDPWPLYDNGK